MYNELKQEIFAKESSVNSFNKELERTIGEIKQEIENVDVERKEVYNKLLNDFNSMANSLSDKFSKEKEFSDNNNERIREVVNELVEKTRIDLAEEKKERESNEDTLLTILENTCMKIESISE